MKLSAVITAMRPGKTPVNPRGSRKSSSSIPKFSPETYSARLIRPIRPAKAAAASDAYWLERDWTPARHQRARPTRTKLAAVLATIAT